MKRWTNCHEEWEDLICREILMFLKLNVATISRLDHRRLFLTCEVHLHEIINEHEEISRFWNDNKKAMLFY